MFQLIIENIKSTSEFISLLRTYKIGDTVEIGLIRGDKPTQFKTTLIEHVEYENEPMVGFLASTPNQKFIFPIDIDIKTGNVGGPSAGMMMALNVYNLLTESDITLGEKIAGTGTIEIDGSSTVFPITVAAAEIFRESNPEVQIPVGISGTGGGMKRFVVGETAISNASREIKDKEAALALENGIEFTELEVAYDGLSVVVNKSNDWIDCITTEELKLIWDQGSTINNWNQVRSSFPDKEMSLYGPGTDSGTFDYFTDVINGEEG